MVTRASGLAEVCCLLCGYNTFMALGNTTVDVTIKNISNRNITSVIEAILNVAAILFLLFNAILLSF